MKRWISSHRFEQLVQYGWPEPGNGHESECLRTGARIDQVCGWLPELLLAGSISIPPVRGTRSTAHVGMDSGCSPWPALAQCVLLASWSSLSHAPGAGVQEITTGSLSAPAHRAGNCRTGPLWAREYPSSPNPVSLTVEGRLVEFDQLLWTRTAPGSFLPQIPRRPCAE